MKTEHLHASTFSRSPGSPPAVLTAAVLTATLLQAMAVRPEASLPTEHGRGVTGTAPGAAPALGPSSGPATRNERAASRRGLRFYMGTRPGLVQRCSNGWHAVRESPAGRNPLDTQRQQVAPQLLPVVKQTEVLGLEPAPPALKPVFLPQLPDQKARVMHCGEKVAVMGEAVEEKPTHL